jgi:hypothetical protein
MENIVSDANENFSDIETAEEHSESLSHEVAKRIQGAGEDGISFRLVVRMYILKRIGLTYPGWWLWFSSISCFYASMFRFLM